MSLYIPAAEQKAGQWRGGQLHEIYRDPPQADFPKGSYRLWVGTATIERSSDYSYFPRAERLHILLSGDGLGLHFQEPGETVLLRAGEFHSFSGERPLHAEVLGSPVFAFNLVYRQGMTSGAEFVRLGAEPYQRPVPPQASGTRTEIVYVVAGRVAVTGAGEDRLLSPGDTLFWDNHGPATQRIAFQSKTADALLLCAFVSDHPQ
jgi:environmental stress-induced protein Ves